MTEDDLHDPDVLADVGGVRMRAVLDAAAIRTIEEALSGYPVDQPGVRLQGTSELRPMLSATGQIGRIAASALGASCRPVRAILFDKSPSTNWSLPWHQDRTIMVRERIEVDRFGPWTVKSGLLHVAPPIEVLERMVTLRVHLDSVTENNAPLLIAAGSHRLGLIPETEVKRVVEASETVACLADAGDVWLYVTPILHRSDAARTPRHRRVLQIDFTASDLPGGLEWLGV